MSKFLKQFAKNESGAAAIEYALICALIGTVIVAGATTLGAKMNRSFNTAAAAIK